MTSYILRIRDDNEYFPKRDLAVFSNLEKANQVCQELNTCYKDDGFYYYIKEIPLALDTTLKEEYKPDLYFSKEYYTYTCKETNRIVDTSPASFQVANYLDNPKYDVEKKMLTGREVKKITTNASATRWGPLLQNILLQPSLESQA
jgi:hypothetical protein